MADTSPKKMPPSFHGILLLIILVISLIPTVNLVLSGHDKTVNKNTPEEIKKSGSFGKDGPKTGSNFETDSEGHFKMANAMNSKTNLPKSDDPTQKHASGNSIKSHGFFNNPRLSPVRDSFGQTSGRVEQGNVEFSEHLQKGGQGGRSTGDQHNLLIESENAYDLEMLVDRESPKFKGSRIDQIKIAEKSDLSQGKTVINPRAFVRSIGTSPIKSRSSFGKEKFPYHADDVKFDTELTNIGKNHKSPDFFQFEPKDDQKVNPNYFDQLQGIDFGTNMPSAASKDTEDLYENEQLLTAGIESESNPHRWYDSDNENDETVGHSVQTKNALIDSRISHRGVQHSIDSQISFIQGKGGKAFGPKIGQDNVWKSALNTLLAARKDDITATGQDGLTFSHPKAVENIQAGAGGQAQGGQNEGLSSKDWF